MTCSETSADEVVDVHFSARRLESTELSLKDIVDVSQDVYGSVDYLEVVYEQWAQDPFRLLFGVSVTTDIGRVTPGRWSCDVHGLIRLYPLGCLLEIGAKRKIE